MTSRRSTGVTASFAAAALLCLSVGAANAQYTVYTDRASFDAAAGAGLSAADFDNVAGDTFQTLSNADTSQIPTGVTFSSNGGTPFDLFVAPADFDSDPAIATPSVFGNNYGSPLIATFAPNVDAVGTDVIPFDGGGDTTTIGITVDGTAGASSFSVSPPAGSSGFFGIIGTPGNTISDITFLPPGGFTAGVADDFEFGAATSAATPEPGSIALFVSSGAIGCLYLRRRRSSK